MKQSGFATTAALMLMVVVSAALLTLGGLLRADGSRTIAEAQDAQLRQILHAAAMDATAKVNAGGDVPKSWDVALPAQLNATARVEFDGQRAMITAHLGTRHMSEIVEIANRR